MIGAYLMGQDLYKYLIIYLNEYLKTLRKVSLFQKRKLMKEAQKYQDEDLLKYYSKQWNRFTQAAEYLNRIFKYLNRHWVKRETDEGRKHVHEVYALALVRWQMELFQQIHEPLLGALLRMIERGRNGEAIQTSLLKEVIGSFGIILKSLN
jgi:cullin 1